MFSAGTAFSPSCTSIFSKESYPLLQWPTQSVYKPALPACQAICNAMLLVGSARHIPVECDGSHRMHVVCGIIPLVGPGLLLKLLQERARLLRHITQIVGEQADGDHACRAEGIETVTCVS